MLPAYIKLKFNQKCLACNEFIESGKNAFYIKEGNQVFHPACGKPEWKVSGSPYDIRIQAAIAYRLSKMSIKDQIKLALRRFRRELSIPADKLGLQSEVFQYLKKFSLIDYDEYHRSYVIVPKGFNWDADKDCVRLPVFDEDIMERDAETDVKVEE